MRAAAVNTERMLIRNEYNIFSNEELKKPVVGLGVRDSRIPIRMQCRPSAHRQHVRADGNTGNGLQNRSQPMTRNSW